MGNNGRLHITHAIGGCQQLVDDLLANSDLRSWVDTDFISVLVPIFEEHTAGAPNVLPHRMGTFTLRCPGKGPSSWAFKASVTFVDDSGQHNQDVLCHFGLKMASEQQRCGPLEDIWSWSVSHPNSILQRRTSEEVATWGRRR